MAPLLQFLILILNPKLETVFIVFVKQFFVAFNQKLETRNSKLETVFIVFVKQFFVAFNQKLETRNSKLVLLLQLIFLDLFNEGGAVDF
jgi:hypothetical protein